MSPLHVGCCISAHGFGHAARTMAVMEALSRLIDIELTIVTLVPEWFLRSSYFGPFTLYPLQTDVGLVQQGPLEQDIPATLRALSSFYPVSPQVISSLTAVFSPCNMVVCDISPAGILGASAAGVPSVLLENFTWDWIYEGYRTFFPELGECIEYLKKVNCLADYRIQAAPACELSAANLTVSPIARAFRESREKIRQRLKVSNNERIVLVSMGGIGVGQLPLYRMQAIHNTVFVLSGYTGKMVKEPHLRFLPPDTDFFHPDLVAASDAVVGKVGYSTLAEVYHADVPFGYVSRKGFRESDPLVSFIKEKMSGLEIESQDFWRGDWVNNLPQLFHLGNKDVQQQNGAIQCAEFLLSLYEQ